MHHVVIQAIGGFTWLKLVTKGGFNLFYCRGFFCNWPRRKLMPALTTSSLHPQPPSQWKPSLHWQQWWELKVSYWQSIWHCRETVPLACTLYPAFYIFFDNRCFWRIHRDGVGCVGLYLASTFGGREGIDLAPPSLVKAPSSLLTIVIDNGEERNGCGL